MKGFVEELKKYFDETPREQILLNWEKSKEWDKIGVGIGIENKLQFDFITNILNDLQFELDNYKHPSGYMDDANYYLACDAKVDAYEDAINIIKKYITI